MINAATACPPSAACPRMPRRAHRTAVQSVIQSGPVAHTRWWAVEEIAAACSGLSVHDVQQVRDWLIATGQAISTADGSKIMHRNVKAQDCDPLDFACLI